MITAPERIKLHRQSAKLEVQFAEKTFQLAAELLRVHSPSAEVQGHGPGQGVLVAGKKHVSIKRLEACGNYGLRLHFDDGHDSGIFTWSYLYRLGVEQEQLMASYESALHCANLSREPDTQVVKVLDP